MRVLKPSPWLASLGALFVLLAAGWLREAGADVTTNRGASILVFPKVISDGTRDTIIQISNTTNSSVRALCFYIRNSVDPGADPNQCDVRDFEIFLTRQQPTIWRASTGRTFDAGNPPSLGECEEIVVDGTVRQQCPGFPPGNIPQLGTDFEGELKCIQVDESRAPIGGNALKGEAILEDVLGNNGGGAGDPTLVASNNISSYNALGVIGISVDQDLTLNLDGQEYNACPTQLTVHHLAQGSDSDDVDPVTGLGIETELTLVPCTEDLEVGLAAPLTVQFLVFDEFEQSLSTSTTVTCWLNETLDDLDGAASIFSAAQRGSTVLRTEIRPSTGSGTGVLAVMEEFRLADVCNGSCTTERVAAAAANATVEGSRPSDTITLGESEGGDE
ncbi:MAG: hypothetical protein KatS3mg076_0138 [Candidatus Binatia bacterium]|nr:MAG: hypothetical protein KatS3mg076_0138 [Candidatus Binatia bacterium]